MPLDARLVKLHCIRKLYTVKVVPIRRAFVLCAGSRSWTQPTTSSLQSRPLGTPTWLGQQPAMPSHACSRSCICLSWHHLMPLHQSIGGMPPGTGTATHHSSRMLQHLALLLAQPVWTLVLLSSAPWARLLPLQEPCTGAAHELTMCQWRFGLCCSN